MEINQKIKIKQTYQPLKVSCHYHHRCLRQFHWSCLQCMLHQFCSTANTSMHTDTHRYTHTDTHTQTDTYRYPQTDRQTDRQTIIHDYSTARWAGLTILNVPSGTHCHQQNVRSLSMRMTVCLNKLQSPWATSGENCMIIAVISFVWQTNGRTNTPPIAKLCSTIAERDNSKYW